MLHIPLTQFCFLPALSHRRKNQKLVDGVRFAGLPTCFCMWPKLSWRCLSPMCLCLLLPLIYLFLLLMANFHLPWAQERGEGIPDIIPFLPQKEATSFKGCFAALPSKVFNAPLFFSSPACKVLPSLFCPHTLGATCKKLNSSNRKKKIKAVIWWTLASSKKDNLFIVCPLPLTPAHSVIPAQVCCSWAEWGKLPHLKTPFFSLFWFGFGGCFCRFCFVCFILKPASSCKNTTGEAARREKRTAEIWVRVMPELQMNKKFTELWL